ncbi:methyltransferase [Streptacidiphilus sp. PAMC 29251]
MRIPTDVLTVLDHAETTGHELRLTGQLDRKLYTLTNKTLEAAGGKWNRKAAAHVFPNPAADILDAILSTGEITTPRDLGYFPTPPSVVHRLLTLADLHTGMTVLEPSAGRGAIAEPVAALGCHVDCVELQTANVQALDEAGYARRLIAGDFLALDPSLSGLFDAEGYDRVVMNPPFAKQADIAHVTHAHRFLKPGGLLVAVMSNSVTFRSGRIAEGFRALLDQAGGALEPLPEGSFQVSGTGVNTVIAVLPALDA